MKSSLLTASSWLPPRRGGSYKKGDLNTPDKEFQPLWIPPHPDSVGDFSLGYLWNLNPNEKTNTGTHLDFNKRLSTVSRPPSASEDKQTVYKDFILYVCKCSAPKRPKEGVRHGHCFEWLPGSFKLHSVVLESEFGSSARAARTSNQSAISPAPNRKILFSGRSGVTEAVTPVSPGSKDLGQNPCSSLLMDSRSWWIKYGMLCWIEISDKPRVYVKYFKSTADNI